MDRALPPLVEARAGADRLVLHLPVAPEQRHRRDQALAIGQKNLQACCPC